MQFGALNDLSQVLAERGDLTSLEQLASLAVNGEGRCIIHRNLAYAAMDAENLDTAIAAIRNAAGSIDDDDEGRACVIEIAEQNVASVLAKRGRLDDASSVILLMRSAAARLTKFVEAKLLH